MQKNFTIKEIFFYLNFFFQKNFEAIKFDLFQKKNANKCKNTDPVNLSKTAI